MANLQSLTVNDTGNLTLPSGSTGQRPTLTTNIVRWTNTGSQAVSVLSGSATTTTTSWTCPAGVTSIEVLVVAGGGAGGAGGTGNPYGGGGGGAGGVIYNASFPVTPTTVYTVTVGAGGSAASASGTPASGSAGNNSVFGSLTAIGGGYGANYTNQTGGTGGSGGGGTAASVVTLSNPPGQGTAGQGFAGGYGHQDNVSQGGGGGGAGGPGTTVFQSGVYPTFAGHGGPGVAYDISGTFTYYGGGGGGSGESTVYGDGGIGGGGTGGNSGNGTAGTASTGGGGGGASRGAGNSAGSGGSGVVIIRYATTASTTLPAGETRYNSTLGVVETYNSKNTWTPRISPTKSETNLGTGLILNLDPSNYVSGTTWADTSGYGNNTTLTNSPIFTSVANGGSYFTLNGSSQYMEFNPNYIFPGASYQSTTAEFTINVWVNWASFPSSNNDEIISWWASGAQTYMDGFLGTSSIAGTGTNANPIIRFGDGWITPVSFNSTTDVNKWINITAIKTVNNAYIYVNGALRATLGSALSWGFNSPARIGYQGAGEYFNGRLGLVQIWNRAFSATEVRNTYNTQLTRYSSSVYLDKPAIVQNGLIFNVDASDPASNPGYTNGGEGYTNNVAFWFDTAGGQHLGLQGYPKFSTAYGAPALYLNGSSQYAQTLSNISMTFNGGRTIEAWAYYTTVSRAQGLFEVGTQSPSYINFYMGTNNFMRLEDFSSSGTAGDITSSTTITTGKWYHFVGVVTNSTSNNINLLELYVNGVREAIGTQTSPFPTSVTGPIKLGAYSGAMTGAIGAARIYNRPLTGNEVQQNFQATRGRYGI